VPLKTLPCGTAEKIGDGSRKGMLISKKWRKIFLFPCCIFKIHDEWLFSLKGP
jgi:hypothetical protein